MTRTRSVIVASVVALLVAAFVLRPLLSALEARLVFFPSRGEDRNPSTLGIPYRQLALTTSDGERIVAWQLEPERPQADVVYFHGNGGNLSVWLPVLAALHRRGLRVLAIDYRGYGLSTGAPTEEGVYRDAAAAVEHAEAQRPSPASRPLIYWGRSLGGPIAAYATRIVSPDGLVLESTFPDKASVIRDQPVLRALNAFATYRFSTVDWLQNFERPVLVMHGDRDSVIPFSLGRELYERLRSPDKRFVAIAGAEHNDAFDAGNRPYWEPVVEFVRNLPPAR